MNLFKEFLIKEYRIKESSAEDYIGRFNGIVNRGLYNGEDEMSPALKASIEREFPKSKQHYVLALERYMAFLNKTEK